MGPGATFSTVTFLSGVLLLLGWIYATTANPRSGAMLRTSLVTFVVPMLFAPVGLLLKLPLGAFLLVAWEEGLKAFASTRERDRFNKFWLVALFGVCELTVDKPWYGFIGVWAGEDWDRLSLAGLVYATALPVLMHTVTAAIYAFAFERRLWAAVAASWTVHAAFNELVDYFQSPIAVIIETLVLAVLLVAILQRRPKAPVTESV